MVVDLVEDRAAPVRHCTVCALWVQPATGKTTARTFITLIIIFQEHLGNVFQMACDPQVCKGSIKMKPQR